MKKIIVNDISSNNINSTSITNKTLHTDDINTTAKALTDLNNKISNAQSAFSSDNVRVYDKYTTTNAFDNIMYIINGYSTFMSLH